MDTNRYTSEGRLIAEINFEIFKINTLLMQGGDRMMKSTSLTIARWLMLLALEDTPITVAQAARLVGIRRQSAQHLVDALAENGLVELVPNQNHRRAMLVKITDLGRGKLRQAEVVHSDATNNLARGMDVNALVVTRETLYAVRRRIKELNMQNAEEEKSSLPSAFCGMSEDLENRLRKRHSA